MHWLPVPLFDSESTSTCHVHVTYLLTDPSIPRCPAPATALFADTSAVLQLLKGEVNLGCSDFRGDGEIQLCL